MTDIALTCGFSSPAHFASSFKRAIGVTPSLFRRL
jgi:AraC-like DNA-binding protein